jgi:signal recognition particle subunit SRP54
MVTLDDFRKQLAKIRTPGVMQKMIMMMPGMGEFRGIMNDMHAWKEIGHQIGLIDAMTVAERRNPQIITRSRCDRIARGAGVQVPMVKRLIKLFDVLNDR